MKPIAKFLSILMHPVFVPLYGFMLLIAGNEILSGLSPAAKLLITAVVFLGTCLTPIAVVAIGMKIGKIGNIMISERSERLMPYIISLAGYVGSVTCLYKLGLSPIYLAPIAGAAVAILLLTVINIRWKISAHLCAIGGLAGGVFAYSFIFGIAPLVLFSAICLVSGALGWARMLLKAHTLSQVCCGWLIGFFCVAASWFVPALFL